MADDRFYVKTLRMQNFRCFEDVTLGPFDPHFNLLVGENGAGKSSVLVALAELFRSIAKQPAGVAHEALVRSSDASDFGNRAAARKNPPQGIEFIAAYQWGGKNRSIKTTFDFNRELYSKTSQDVERLPSSLSEIYPVLVRFSTARRFLRRANVSGDDEPSEQYQRRDAFRDWADAGASADELRRWLRDETLIAFEQYRDAATGRPTALALVSSACAEAIEGSVDVSYSGTNKDILVSFSDGRKLQFSTMSDGQRSLVGLISEIARRMCVLNWSILRDQCLTDTPGLVLIDEIDLHLHPKWQRQIVPALKKIFPKIQFFATTHSPQVIGEARPEEIVLLTKDGQQQRPAGSYGMDSNWILECVMEAEGRDPEIGKRIKSLFDLIEEDRLEEAKAEIRKLREELPAVAPDIVSAEVYIWNLEHGADEAAE